MTAAPGPSTRLFEDLLADVEARTGLAFAGHQRERMVAAVRRSMATAGTGCPGEYQRLLASEPEVFARLAERVTVAETFFFRERRQLEVARDLLTESEPVGVKSVRAWSAGCASGEEAYTLAMLLEPRTLGRAHVVGTDLSEQALARARAGVYGSWSLRGINEEEHARYFQPDGNFVRVRARYRRDVRFEARNLLDGPPGHGCFNLVLCRNVLIYLTSSAIAKVARVLGEALAPGGLLVTGSSDPLLDVDGLERVVERGVLGYRRAPLASTGVARAVSRRAATGGGLTAPVANAPFPAVAVEGSATPRFRPVEAEQRDESQPVPASVDAEARYLAAIRHLDAGRLDEAASDAAAAVYLAPELAAAHLLSGAIAALDRRADHARRWFRNAAELLAVLPPDAVVPLAKEPAGHLAAVAAQRARA